MTGPGPIPTGGIPDVKPLYFAQTPGLAQALTPQVQLLLSVLQQNKERQDEADKRALNRITGNALAATFTAADSELIPAPGNAAFNAVQRAQGALLGNGGISTGDGGMGTPQGPFAPVNAEGPVARGLRGVPGEAVLAAAPYLTGILATQGQRKVNREKAYLDMVAERAKAAFEQGKPSFTHFVTEDGHVAVIDQHKGTGVVATYAEGPKKGQPIPVARNTEPGPKIGSKPYLDKNRKSPTYGQLVFLPEGQPIDPGSYIDLDVAKSANAKSAAGFLSTMQTAYKQTRYTVPPMSEADRAKLANVFGSLATANQDQGLLTYISSKMTLTNAQRGWLESMLDLTANTLYLDSGKAVTVGEWNRRVANSMPNLFDPDAIREQKWERLEGRMDQISAEAEGWYLMLGRKDIEPFIELRHRLRAENAVGGTFESMMDAVEEEHPDWGEAAITREARKRYTATRPAVGERPKGRFVQPRRLQ